MARLLEPADPFLFVIDVQGKLAEIVHDSNLVRRNVCRLIEGAKIFRYPVVATEQVPEAIGATVPEVVAALGGRPTLTKTTFSCWREPTIRQAVEGTGRRTALLCGIEAHVCVYQTAMDLLAAGLEVFVVRDAVSSRMLENRDIACDRLAAKGAQIVSTEMVLFELMKDCASPDFRRLVKLVK